MNKTTLHGDERRARCKNCGCFEFNIVVDCNFEALRAICISCSNEIPFEDVGEDD